MSCVRLLLADMTLEAHCSIDCIRNKCKDCGEHMTMQRNPATLHRSWSSCTSCR